MVLIGLLAGTSSISKDIWLESLKEAVPQKFLDVNVRAFNAGYMVR